MKEELANIINQVWEKPLSKEKYVTKLKKYKIPKNVNLTSKRCNQEVWNNILNARQKSIDLKFQKIQTGLVKSTACIIDSVNDWYEYLSKTNESNMELSGLVSSSVKKALDATTFLSGLHSYTNKMRREFMSQRSTTLKGISSNQEGSKSELLFGENVSKQMSEFKTSMKNVKEDNSSKNFQNRSKSQSGDHKGYNKNRYRKNKGKLNNKKSKKDSN